MPHGDTGERVGKRFEARVGSVVFNLYAAQEIISRVARLSAIRKSAVGPIIKGNLKIIAAVSAGNVRLDAEVAMHVTHVRALETVCRAVIAGVELLVRIAAVEFVFLVFVRLVLSNSTGAQDTRQ